MGAFSCIWFLLWSFLLYDSPASHPRISKEELDYIQNSIGTESKTQMKGSTPWKAIFTSMPFWTIVVGHTGHVWGKIV